jgi:SOS-response transcriptional repressor LexA
VKNMRLKRLEKKLIDWNDGEWYGASARLTREAKINKNTVSSWLNGRFTPEDEEVMERAARALGITIGEFKSYFSDGDRVKELSVVNPNDVNLPQTSLTSLVATRIPVYGKVSGGTFWLDLSHPTEDTMPIVKPATGTYIGLGVHGNGLEEYRLFNGDKLMLELSDKALHDELVLVKEGEEFAITRYNKGKEKREVVGIVRGRFSSEI